VFDEVDIDGGVTHLHPLRVERAQVHLDAPVFPAVSRFVGKRAQIEVAIEFAIDAGQQVEVKAGGDERRIVIGADHATLFFFQVGSEQQSVAGKQTATDVDQEALRFVARKISDRAAEK